MIRAEGLGKIYKGDLYETEALKQVSFQIEAGELVAIMGESGSGKSTLLHIIGGMDCATAGEIYINSVNTQVLNPKQMDKFRKENISFVFQHFALLEQYSVYENLESPLIARNINKVSRKEIITKTLKELGIEELKNKYPTQVSGGQKQRIAIGRALVTNCPIILADEPTGALDSVTAQSIMEIFGELNKQGKTIVIVTHDKEVANKCNRIIRLKNGELVSE